MKHIIGIYTHPDMRMRGLASHLMKHMLELHKDCDFLYDAKIMNVSSIKLVESCGFTSLGNRRHLLITKLNYSESTLKCASLLACILKLDERPHTDRSVAKGGERFCVAE